jgi:hypothetical protein
MIRYTAWLAMLGTIAATSMQPYFPAVNKFFRDDQRQPIAVGELLADARRGLEMLQHRLVPADTRLPLPAPVALDILLAPSTSRANLMWSHAIRTQLERFRACLAVCVNYTFVCRAKTGANPILADLLDYYSQNRAAFCATFYKRPPHAAFWSFSLAEASADRGAASTLSALLSLALRTVNTSAPAGFKWTSHNLRKGDASAASCIGAPLPVIKYMGGRAKNSSVTEGKYIDPTMTPTPLAWRFFGWLAPSPTKH